jgi:katanin p60 ATPase-containing subunit A1
VRACSSLLKDIRAEAAAIARIEDVVVCIARQLDGSASDTSDFDESGNAQWGRNDDILDLPPARKLRGRDRRPHVEGVGAKRSPASRQPPGFSVTPIKPSTSARADPVRRPREKPTKPPAADPPKPSVDVSSNPLAQQLVDMGILVRDPNVAWDQIAGLAQVKRLLRQNLVLLPMRPDIARGLLAPWKSGLVYGPPGTGKTFLAKAVATERSRTFFNITSATITSKWHGESEKLIACVFDLADQMAPSTIFFDEVDAVASQRGGETEHEASRRMKAMLLMKLEGIDRAADNPSVFVLAATNFPWDLDEALLRRFQKRIYIPLPDADGRMAILNMHLADLVEDFAIRDWAEQLEGYSCADIANLCRDAAQIVFDERMEKMDPDEFMRMGVDEARIVIRDADFAKAVRQRKSSVDAGMIGRVQEWKRVKGAE